MRPRPPSRMCCAALAGVLACVLCAGAARAAERQSAPAPARPTALVVKAEIRNILADSRFAPTKTFGQWLSEKLSGWHGPAFMSEGFGRVVLWILFIWCILALAAILAHFGWTLYILLHGASPARGPSLSLSLYQDYYLKSGEELCKRMRELAEQGKFREAIGIMMLALLRRLDDAGVLRFHQSKTNGEYIRECPQGVPCKDDFNRFVLSFDSEIYGGAPSGPAAYQRMNSIFEQIIGNVGKKP